jgi:hypothetical protein
LAAARGGTGDGGAQVLSYFNSANPAQPFSGPNNSGSANMTVRQCKCIVSLKAGVPATTGTQTAPAPDAGFIGLYTITVANGASQITSGNITQLANAPFFPTLPQVPHQVQQGTYVYAGQDTGAGHAVGITLHECPHVIFDNQGLEHMKKRKDDREEQIVLGFEAGLVSLFRDNPKLLTWMKKYL